MYTHKNLKSFYFIIQCSPDITTLETHKLYPSPLAIYTYVFLHFHGYKRMKYLTHQTRTERNLQWTKIHLIYKVISWNFFFVFSHTRCRKVAFISKGNNKNKHRGTLFHCLNLFQFLLHSGSGTEIKTFSW